MGYLRFPKHEIQAIVSLCRSIHLTEGFFPYFKRFLVQSLPETLPDLAQRIAGFRTYQLGILYEYLKSQRGWDKGPDRDTTCDLTAEELQAVMQASGSCLLPARFRVAYRNYLVRRFGRIAPALSRKLDGLSERQIERLWHQVQERRKRSA